MQAIGRAVPAAGLLTAASSASKIEPVGRRLEAPWCMWSDDAAAASTLLDEIPAVASVATTGSVSSAEKIDSVAAGAASAAAAAAGAAAAADGAAAGAVVAAVTAASTAAWEAHGTSEAVPGRGSTRKRTAVFTESAEEAQDKRSVLPYLLRRRPTRRSCRAWHQTVRCLVKTNASTVVVDCRGTWVPHAVDTC